LKTEIPFSTVITELLLPGKVIAEMVQFSRKYSLLDPPNPKGAYLQIDDSIECDSNNCVLSINGEVINLEQK